MSGINGKPVENRPRCLLNELCLISALAIQLGLLEGEYLADPATFKKRLTPALAECALNTPKVEGRIRWRDFITFLSDDGVTELFWVLKGWHDEKH